MAKKLKIPKAQYGLGRIKLKTPKITLPRSYDNLNSLYRVVDVPYGSTTNQIVNASKFGTTIPLLPTVGRRTGYTHIQQDTPFDVLNTTNNQNWVLGTGPKDKNSLINLYGGNNPFVVKMSRENPYVGPETLTSINNRTDVLNNFQWPYTQNVGKWNPVTGQFDLPLELGSGVYTTLGKSVDDLAKIPPGSIVNPNYLSRGNNNITTIFGPKGTQVRDVQGILSAEDYLKLWRDNPNFKFNKGGELPKAQFGKSMAKQLTKGLTKSKAQPNWGGDFTKYSATRRDPMIGGYAFKDIKEEYEWLQTANKMSDNFVTARNPIYNPLGEMISYDMPNLIDEGYIQLDDYMRKTSKNSNIRSLAKAQTSITKLIEEINKEGLFHLDMHGGNIMVKPGFDGKILDYKIIDPVGLPQITSDLDFGTFDPVLGGPGLSYDRGYEKLQLDLNPSLSPGMTQTDKYKSVMDFYGGMENYNKSHYIDIIESNRKAAGGELPKAQRGLFKFNKTNFIKPNWIPPSPLPKPNVTTIPFQKRLAFNQVGQIIPQQHMVNLDRGPDGLSKAIEDIMSGEPMWFAPVGDTRYLDQSLSFLKNPEGTRIGNTYFHPIDHDIQNFVPGHGWPTVEYMKNEIGNTGKLGINEYPLTELEKLGKENKGYNFKYIKDKDGNTIDMVPDYNNPIMRTESITKPGFQSKIEGVFSPDIKFKIFDDIDLSKQGHVMHHGWSPSEFQSIIDEGYDAIQLTKDGVQLENILLNPEKFKMTTINEMPVEYAEPPFQKGGQLPKAQFGKGIKFKPKVRKKVALDGRYLPIKKFDNVLSRNFTKGEQYYLQNTLAQNPSLITEGRIDLDKLEWVANENLMNFKFTDHSDLTASPGGYGAVNSKWRSLNDGEEFGMYNYHNLLPSKITLNDNQYSLGAGSLNIDPSIIPQISAISAPGLVGSRGYLDQHHDGIGQFQDGTLGWYRGFVDKNHPNQFNLTELQNDLNKDPLSEILSNSKSFQLKNQEKTGGMNEWAAKFGPGLPSYNNYLESLKTKSFKRKVRSEKRAADLTKTLNDKHHELEMLQAEYGAGDGKYGLDSKVANKISELQHEIKLINDNMAREDLLPERSLWPRILEMPDLLQSSRLYTDPTFQMNNQFLSHIQDRGFNQLVLPNKNSLGIIEKWPKDFELRIDDGFGDIINKYNTILPNNPQLQNTGLNYNLDNYGGTIFDLQRKDFPAMKEYGGQTKGYALDTKPDKTYKTGGCVYNLKKAQDGVEVDSYDTEYEGFENWLQEQETSWDYVKNTNSAVLKPDGKTYYKMYEDGLFYPYYLKNSDGTYESKATIGFGKRGADVYETYKDGMSLEDAEKFRTEDIDNSLRKTKVFIDANYGENAYDNLPDNTKFMLTDFTYNLGKLSKYPKFADAIMKGDTEAALEHYIRNDEPGGSPLARNEAYLEKYLQPWINKIIEMRNKKMQQHIKMQQQFVAPADNTAVGNNPFGGWRAGGETHLKYMQNGGENGGKQGGNINDVFDFNTNEFKNGWTKETIGDWVSQKGNSFNNIITWYQNTQLPSMSNDLDISDRSTWEGKGFGAPSEAAMRMYTRKWNRANLDKFPEVAPWLEANPGKEYSDYSKAYNTYINQAVPEGTFDGWYNTDFGTTFGLAHDAGIPGFFWGQNNKPYTTEELDDNIFDWRSNDQINDIQNLINEGIDMDMLINNPDLTNASGDDYYNYMMELYKDDKDKSRLLRDIKKNYPEKYTSMFSPSANAKLYNQLRSHQGKDKSVEVEDSGYDEYGDPVFSEDDFFIGMNTTDMFLEDGSLNPHYDSRFTVDYGFNAMSGDNGYGVGGYNMPSTITDANEPVAQSHMVDAYLMSNEFNKGAKSAKDFAANYNKKELADFKSKYLEQYFRKEDGSIDEEQMDLFLQYNPTSMQMKDGDNLNLNHNPLFEHITMALNNQINVNNVGNNTMDFNTPGGAWGVGGNNAASIYDYGDGDMPMFLRDRRMGLLNNKGDRWNSATENWAGQLVGDMNEHSNKPTTWWERNVSAPWNGIGQWANAPVGAPPLSGFIFNTLDWAGGMAVPLAVSSLPGNEWKNDVFGEKKYYDAGQRFIENPTLAGGAGVGLDAATVLAPYAGGLRGGLINTARNSRFLTSGLNLNKGIKGNYNMLKGNLSDFRYMSPKLKNIRNFDVQNPGLIRNTLNTKGPFTVNTPAGRQYNLTGDMFSKSPINAPFGSNQVVPYGVVPKSTTPWTLDQKINAGLIPGYIGYGAAQSLLPQNSITFPSSTQIQGNLTTPINVTGNRTSVTHPTQIKLRK